MSQGPNCWLHTPARPLQDWAEPLPKLFRFYTKMPMEKKALELVEKCLDEYFQHPCDDLDVFAAHAGCKTVRLEDLKLRM